MSYPHTSRHGAALLPASPTIDDLELIPATADWGHPSSDAAQRAARRTADRRGRRTVHRQPPSLDTTSPAQYLRLWSRYVALFVGAGLISGSVVHYPLDPGRYLLIGAVGAALFALASAFHEARARLSGPIELLRFVVASLVLALGIGMISGGIQHFNDIPERAATLIPLGGALSLLAFASRDGHRMRGAHVRRLGGAVATGLLLLAVTLGQVANGVQVTEGEGHSHTSATDKTVDEAAVPSTAKSSAQDAATTPDALSTVAEHAADGHSHAAVAE